MTIKKWLKENAHILSGKTIAITGSTGGLGNEICDILAELEANLLLLNRNLKKSENQKTKLLEKYPNLKSLANLFYINNLIAVCNKQLFINIYKSDVIKLSKKSIPPLNLINDTTPPTIITKIHISCIPTIPLDIADINPNKSNEFVNNPINPANNIPLPNSANTLIPYNAPINTNK